MKNNEDLRQEAKTVKSITDNRDKVENEVARKKLAEKSSEKRFVNEEYIKYLTSLYQNVTTALQSIEDLMPKVAEYEDLKKELSNEYTKYDIVARECELIAKSEKINLKDNTWFEKLRLWGSIKMTTLMDKSRRHIAEMMLLGTVMGLIQCLKDIRDYEGVSAELDDICNEIYEMEESNYQTLKDFF